MNPVKEISTKQVLEKLDDAEKKARALTSQPETEETKKDLCNLDRELDKIFHEIVFLKKYNQEKKD